MGNSNHAMCDTEERWCFDMYRKRGPLIHSKCEDVIEALISIKKELNDLEKLHGTLTKDNAKQFLERDDVKSLMNYRDFSHSDAEKLNCNINMDDIYN